MDETVQKYLDQVLSLLEIVPEDQQLLNQVLAAEQKERANLMAKISSESLKQRLTDALPELELAESLRPSALQLQSDLKEIGGQLFFEPQGPQWLYLATTDAATEVFQTPVAIDLYNGNNPLKGRGGKNEAVTEDWLKRIAEFPTIKKLNLSNCQIEDDWLTHVGTMTGLQELGLTLTPITDAGLAHLGSLTELRSLGLASSQCTGTGFTHLTALKKLESVNFHFTPLNDAGLRAIAQVGISGRFWFAHTHFTDEGAASLAKLTKLRSCGIGSKVPGSSGEAVSALSQLPLVELSLLDNQATNAGIIHAAKIQTLRKLDVSHGPDVNDEAMQHLAQMPALEEFKLGSAKVTDAGLQHLIASKSLKKLSLSRLKQVTEEGISKLRAANPKLTIEIQ